MSEDDKHLDVTSKSSDPEVQQQDTNESTQLIGDARPPNFYDTMNVGECHSLHQKNFAHFASI
jgi:hypothetical protein